MKAMKHTDLAAPDAGALRSVTVRHASISWMRKYHRIPTDALRDEEDDGGDDSNDSPRTARLPIMPSAEAEAFSVADRRLDAVTSVAAAFRAAARKDVARLAATDRGFRRRLRSSGASRATLFAMLRRPSLLESLLRDNGRDTDEGASAEATGIASRYAADIRTVRNRRADWQRFLRDRYANELKQCRLAIKRMFPEIRGIGA
jgi:hypothetical protein